jgi:mRNA-degrading endonuclease RelE of RelBE toxin-antitoxin system
MERTFFQTQIFSKKLDGRGGDYFLRAIEDEILKNPEAGDTVAGTGGVRKLRVGDPARGKGKRGGYRVLYLDLPDCAQTFLITFYGKDEADDLSSDGKKLIAGLVASIKAEKE